MVGDKISLLDAEITSHLGERMMSEMITVVLDFNALKERVAKLESEQAEMKNDTKKESDKKLARASIWTAIIVGTLQILLILYQIFRT